MTGVITRFGVLGVFLLMVPESACIPVPSEVTLLFSGFAVHQGWMSFRAASCAPGNAEPSPRRRRAGVCSSMASTGRSRTCGWLRGSARSPSEQGKGSSSGAIAGAHL
jgi:hypothetical protein